MSLSTTIAAPPQVPTYTKSALTEQLDHDDGEATPRSNRIAPAITPTKQRSLSDAPKLGLIPSPQFREPTRRTSKDDSALHNPSTPRRPPVHTRGLSLTMPNKDGQADAPGSRVPLSPKLETSHIYVSPASMLPRRSRGLDYTRACTNLHHSTLAISSPDASPVAGRGVNIPQRRSMGGSTVLDSPSNASAALWSTIPERTHLSSSVSSVNMLDSDSDTDVSSDEDMAIDREADDPMINTPAASRLNSNVMGAATHSPGMEWQNPPQPSPAQASLMSFHSNLMSFRRARMKKGKSHHSSSSVSMNSSRPSPGPLSPGIVKSVEPNGYFGMTRAQVQSRRESLSLGTDDLHLSDPEETQHKNASQHSSDMDGANSEGPRGIVKRAVTRRSNLLPKTKGFARIKAALIEESTPVDSEVRREAEVIRQVQDSDPVLSPHKSPPALFTSQSMQSEENPVPSVEPKSQTSATFGQHAERNSAGLGFWNAFDERYRTPPPAFLPRESSGAISDENDTPASGTNALLHFNRSRSRSNTPLAHYSAPTAGDVARRVNNKRRRDDDFDPAFTKRRAVSPGMSVQSSPVLPQSPVMTSDKSWGKPPAKVNGSGNGPGGGERSNSGSSTKKVGMQGMNDANEGIMSMSID